MTSPDWPFEFFTPHELQSPDTGETKMNEDFMYRLDNLRERFGFPIAVTSGYRTPYHNKAVGGSPKSAHILGRAADIVVIPERRTRLIHWAHRIGFTGIGIAETFIHLDDMDGTDRKRPYLWIYK